MKHTLKLYFRPLAQPLPEALRSIREVDGITFIERLATAEQMADDPEQTVPVVMAVTDDEAELVLLHRTLFPWDITLVTGLDGVSLWWANAASVYGSLLFSELLSEDQSLSRNEQRKQDVARGSAVADQLDPIGLAQETTLRRRTRAQGAAPNAGPKGGATSATSSNGGGDNQTEDEVYDD